MPMDSLMLIATVVLLILLALMIYLWFKQVRKNHEMQTLNAVLEERVAVQTADYERLNELLTHERKELSEQFSKNFSVMASDILDQKARSMNVVANENIANLLKPLSENLKDFREKIDLEGKHRFALQSEVQRLAELNAVMSRQAQSLTEAMRGNSKTQGDWGEMILETLLENSGLKQGIHFKTQQTIKNEDGANLRPDVILSLPDEKQVVIDSKVSLTAYVNYTEATETEDQKRALSLHITSLRNHINELGAKKYNTLLGGSPDFVIMFIPTEPALLIGLQSAPELWQEAYTKGVILSSPSNLFGILRIVDDLWRRDTQSRYAIEIARQGGDLYDKFVLFAENFLEVGKAINKSADLFSKTKSQLSEGTGNLVRRTEKLRELGVKATKKLPGEFQNAIEE